MQGCQWENIMVFNGEIITKESGIWVYNRYLRDYGESCDFRLEFLSMVMFGGNYS